MATIKRFEELEAWRAARAMTGTVYRLSRRVPLARDFALRDQIRAAAISVMANIAEGFERDSPRDFIRFLCIAKASAAEVESHAYLALDLEYASGADLAGLHDEVTRAKKLIRGLIRCLRSL